MDCSRFHADSGKCQHSLLAGRQRTIGIEWIGRLHRAEPTDCALGTATALAAVWQRASPLRITAQHQTKKTIRFRGISDDGTELG